MGDSITIRFDRAADEEAKKGVEPIFNTDGKPVVMRGLFNRRVKAQMKSALVQQKMRKKAK